MTPHITINAYGECARCKGPVIEQGGFIVDKSPVEVKESAVGPCVMSGKPVPGQQRVMVFGLVGFLTWPMPAGLRLVVGGREVEAAPGMTGHRPHEATCCVPFREGEVKP